MRDYTNLAWPEGPFGAAQRPFGKPNPMVAAFAIDWSRQREPVPVAAATVYLRVRKHGQPLPVSADTLSIGFRATVTEHHGEVPELLALADRVLTRARRHAWILAGHDLTADLSRLMDLSPVPLRGAIGVQQAWETRSARQRGMALMIDTSAEAHDTGKALNLALDPFPPQGDGRDGAGLTRTVLARCLAIGLTAAVHAGRYHLEGTFAVHDAIERAGWDVLTTPIHLPVPDPPGPEPVASVNAIPTTR